MGFSTIITMILVLGIVWGDLARLLLRAINFEKLKSYDSEN